MPLEYTIDGVKENPKKRAVFVLKSAISALSQLPKSIPSLLTTVGLIEGRTGSIIVTGVGKSGFVGQKISATLTSLGHRAVFLHPVDALHGDLGAVSAGDVVIAISYSGESNEVIKLTKYLKKNFGIVLVSITKNQHSTLGKISDVVVPLDVKEEGSPHGVAPMASTTAALVVGDMLAAALTEPQRFRKDHFARLHPGGGLALSLRTVKEVMKQGDELPLIEESVTFTKALTEMSKKRLGVTGVTNQSGALVGVITDGDVRRFLASKKFSTDTCARDMMTKNPKTIAQTKSLKEALAIMEEYRITALFIVERKRPVGLVHIHDIVETTL